MTITMSPELCRNCGLVSLVNESKDSQDKNLDKWTLTPVDLLQEFDKDDFSRIVDEELFSKNVRWLLEGFCSTENGQLAISSGWIDKCNQTSTNSHVIENVGIGIFSSWSVHSSRGYEALLMVYDSQITIRIYEEIRNSKRKKILNNYLKITSSIFDEFLNTILLQSTYEYTGSLISGTTSLSQYGEKSGLLILGEAGKDKNSNSPLLPYNSRHSGEFLIYDIFQNGNRKVATFVIPFSGAEILNLKKISNGNPNSGPFEVRNFGIPIDLLTAHLNSGIQSINLEMIRDKSVEPTLEALFTCRSNSWALLERSIADKVDYEEVVLSACEQRHQGAWGDILLQLRGRRPEAI